MEKINCKSLLLQQVGGGFYLKHGKMAFRRFGNLGIGISASASALTSASASALQKNFFMPSFHFCLSNFLMKKASMVKPFQGPLHTFLGVSAAV